MSQRGRLLIDSYSDYTEEVRDDKIIEIKYRYSKEIGSPGSMVEKLHTIPYNWDERAVTLELSLKIDRFVTIDPREPRNLN